MRKHHIPKLEATTPPITYPPVGRCIYCGADDVKLFREHIIALGLAGNHVLPEASCEACANVTKKFEQASLRTSLGYFRIRQNMPTRRRKTRPKSLPYVIATGPNQFKQIELPADQLPRTIVLMKLPLPTILTGGVPVENQFTGDLWISYEKDDLDMMRKVHGARSHLPGRLLISEFVQMVAKIAYCHAIAQMGYGSFRPLVLDVIFGRTKIPTHWVGGYAPDRPPREDVMHQMILDTDFRCRGHRYIVVDVRLFAYLGAPIYRVVVGEHYSATQKVVLMFDDLRKRIAKTIALRLGQFVPFVRKIRTYRRRV